MGVIFHPCSSLCGSQQTLDHAGDQCVQCFIDGILYLALFKWYPQREFLGNPVFHRIYMYLLTALPFLLSLTVTATMRMESTLVKI